MIDCKLIELYTFLLFMSLCFGKKQNEFGKAMQNFDTLSLYIDIPSLKVDEFNAQVKILHIYLKCNVLFS